LILPPMKDAKGKIRYLAIGAGKDQNIYIVDRTNIGKFNPNNRQCHLPEESSEAANGRWQPILTGISTLHRKETTCCNSGSRKPDGRRHRFQKVQRPLPIRAARRVFRQWLE
jgi:hypothetical protein